MRINIIAVGKIREKYLSEGIAEYLKRCSRYAEINFVEVAEAPASKSADEQRAAESAALFQKASGFIIALDPAGQQLGSGELAGLISAKCTEGRSEFSFLIGGSRGLNRDSLRRADAVLSFGRMTFPHQLFRLMLTEQIYRALTIIAGTPYHK